VAKPRKITYAGDFLHHYVGFIMVSAISIDSAGSFRATGILVTGNKTVSSVDFTVQ
jgi:hypothetical protein